MSWDISRRVFLRGAGLAALGVGFRPSSLLVRTAEAAGAGPRVLVHVFLRGGCDGLNFCVPIGDAEYFNLRVAGATGGIALGRGEVVNLDGYFGLHPSLAPLKVLYDQHRLGFVHAVGNYGLTRSHFDAQDFMQTGTPGNRSTTDGWLDRTLARIPGTEVMQGVAFSSQLPRAFLGSQSELVASNLATFSLRARTWLGEADGALRGMYGADGNAQVATVGRDTFAAMDVLLRSTAVFGAPANGAVYPGVGIGNSLRQAAQIIKAGLGARCIYVDVSGAFDTHANQLPANTIEFTRIADALVAFDTDLGALRDDVLLLMTTEFGRAAFVNGSNGTDHGSAGVALVMGGRIRGGQVLGRWPGLAKSQLYQERDLAVTTDFRDLFAEVARVHLGVDSSTLFPGYTPGAGVGVAI